jgi:hypothetical protein
MLELFEDAKRCREGGGGANKGGIDAFYTQRFVAKGTRRP